MLMAALWATLTLLIVFVHGLLGECPTGWLDCQNGKCIATIWVCDGDNDCGNNRDERDCEKSPSRCSSSEFQCTEDKHCIPKPWQCDGAHDCLDNSDELNCDEVSCSHGFRCRNNLCIPSRWKCDGRNDCPDNSDEDSCPSSKLCSNSEFTCGSGSCLDATKVCDGQRDCPDGSDEGEHCNDKCNNASCSQECHSTPHGPECYCHDGYELDKRDNKTCSDIDECAEDGFCSQHCTNIIGTYECSCLDGYLLENNTCKAAGADPVLIFTTTDEIRAIYLRSRNYFPVHKSITKISGFDVDILTYRVYWTEIANKSSIYSSDIDGAKLETVLHSGLMVPEGIAVDYLGRNLYITDSGLKQVLVCKKDGSMCHVLHDTNVEKPRAISLDVSEGLVYWSDWGDVWHGIYRSDMDGSRRVAMVSQNVKWPNGITIDHSTDRLYWTDAFQGTIEYITLDGKTRKVVLQDGTFHPYSLTVFEDNLYWSDWNTFSVDTCNKFSGHKFEVVVREKKHVLGTHVYHPVLTKNILDHNPCWNSPCSHMCLLAPLKDFSCACPPGFKLNLDRRSCSIDSSFPMLWVNDETNIYHVRPQSVGSTAVNEVPVPHLQSIRRMAYDWKTKALYIIDTQKPAIYSVNTTTLVRRELVRNHLVTPCDLAYDWFNGNLYWLDSSKGTAEVVSTSSTRTATVVVDLSKPTAIALRPSNGLMFISTTGEDQSVAVYDLDGKNRKVLIGSSSFVVALAVHPTLSRLFLVDPRKEQISFINYFSPASTQNIVKSNTGSVLSIAVDEKFVYWTESSKHVLTYMSQNKTLSNEIALPGHTNGLVSRKVVYASEPSKHPNVIHCEQSSSCTYLCLGSPYGITCVCPIGMQLSPDGRSCEEKECTTDEFKCAQSHKCLPREFQCDGVKDCEDGSDELCSGVTKQGRCPGDDLQCANGRCIMASWKCDHRDDCGDGSDEIGCPPSTSCGKTQYHCADDECIPLLWRCDGENDCNDHSDEVDCHNTSCDPDTLRCDHGQCIPRSWSCDGTNDCFDGTDERNCSSARTCDSKQFRCDDGICIDKTLVCDQRTDCEDGSDEKNCTRETCKEGKHQCADKTTCIYFHEVCDQVKDCPHGDDEVNCTRKESDCKLDQYFCSNNSRCISKGWLCDGDNDCGDASDENPDNCTRRVKPTLPPHKAFLECEEFFCVWKGGCIPWSKVCDGVHDCADLTDEAGACSTACRDFSCSQLCQKTPEGSKCSCYPGYSLMTDEVTCEDMDECSIPGTCSQFCSNKKGGFTCSCAEGYLLEQHSKCKAEGGPATLAYLLLDQIRGIDLSSHAQRVYVTREEGAAMKGMDYDAEKGLFFFTDNEYGLIFSYNPNNNKPDRFLTMLDRPRFLRWDWIAKNLYFTNDEGSIVACTGDGKYCNTLVMEAAKHIDGFDIAPRKGVMFWCVWGDGKSDNGLIQRADLDGSLSRTIVRNGLGLPNAVTVDHVMEMLYWVDSKLNVMECVDFHGFQRRIVVAEGMSYPSTMALFEDYVYWSNWGTDSIIMCNKHTGRECKGLHETNTKSQMFMVVHPVNQQKWENKCHNSGCPHLCLPTQTNFSCLCDRNYHMIEGLCLPTVTDIMPETTTRKSNCFPDPCDNGARCEELDDGSGYICLCPDGYTGDKCDVQQAAVKQPYDSTWVVGLVLAILSLVLIVLVAIYCRMKRDKLAQMSESVAVSFRKRGFARKGGACEQLVPGEETPCEEAPCKKGFRNPLFGKKPKVISDPESPPPDGDFKRWPSFDSADSAFVSGDASREVILSIDASPLSGSVNRISHFFKR